jgi:3-oxoacyl-[acyl-carrier protein] reductase
VIYGAAGSVGRAVARAFAREGAAVFLAGRTLAPLEAVAEEIRQAGGVAATAVVDALDEASVDRHADAVAGAGSLDVTFNAISVDHIQGVPLADMTEEDIVGPVARRVATHLLTARAAARHMTARRRGVILTFTADAARLPYREVGSFGIACAAVEGLTRTLAAEYGPYGVRAVCLRSMGRRTPSTSRTCGSSGPARPARKRSSTPGRRSRCWVGCRCLTRSATSLRCWRPTTPARSLRQWST